MFLIYIFSCRTVHGCSVSLAIWMCIRLSCVYVIILINGVVWFGLLLWVMSSLTDFICSKYFSLWTLCRCRQLLDVTRWYGVYRDTYLSTLLRFSTELVYILLHRIQIKQMFSSPPQRPMTSDFEGFSIADFIHYIYFPILVLDPNETPCISKSTYQLDSTILTPTVYDCFVTGHFSNIFL